MNKTTVSITLVIIALLTGCSSNPSNADNAPDSSQASITSAQIESKRLALYYEIGSDTPYTGTVNEYYSSGEKRESVDIEQGLPSGSMVQWYRSGQRAAEANIDASKTGHVVQWYENGQVKAEADMVNGAPSGLTTTWYPNGQKKNESNHLVEGRPYDGTSTEWYENGQMKSEVSWVSGQKRCSKQWDLAGNEDSNWCPGDPASIGVLPFVNMSADADGEAVSDGITESINQVLELQEMDVASRAKSFAFKGTYSEISNSPGVSHILEGSVSTSGDRIRITAQLIRSDNGFHLWSDTYDRTLAELPAVQAQIAEQVANILEVQ